MRAESTTIARAFLARKPKRAKRTATDGESLTLHGNTIAWWNPDGSISMTLCGWGTVTTRDRLNTLCQLLIDRRPFHQVKHVQHFDERPISASDVFTLHPIADELPLAA
jgi:hypothetical protein